MCKQSVAGLFGRWDLGLQKTVDEGVECQFKGKEASRRGLPDLDVFLNAPCALFDQNFVENGLPVVFRLGDMAQGDHQQTGAEQVNGR